MARGLTRTAVLPVLLLAALLVPAAASAYTVTVHVHGAGAVREVAGRGLMDCTVGPAGIAQSSVTDCVAQGYAAGDHVRLAPSVGADATRRGWLVAGWMDASALGPAACAEPSADDCELSISGDESVDLWFADRMGPWDTDLWGTPSPTATSASFGFRSVDDPDATFQCRLDRPEGPGTWFACGGPGDQSETVDGLNTEGGYVFTVRGYDPTGNASSPVIRMWAVDRSPPVVSLRGGPAEGSHTTATSVSFIASTSEGLLRCTLDGLGAPCGTIDRIAVGHHVLVVTGTDVAGNAASVSRAWTIDRLPRLTGRVRQRFIVDRATTTVGRLELHGLPRGAHVAVACRGKRCPITVASAKAPRSGVVDVRRLLGRKPLRAGQVITIRISARGFVTGVATFTIRRGRLPAQRGLGRQASSSARPHMMGY